MDEYVEDSLVQPSRRKASRNTVMKSRMSMNALGILLKKSSPKIMLGFGFGLVLQFWRF